MQSLNNEEYFIHKGMVKLFEIKDSDIVLF